MKKYKVLTLEDAHNQNEIACDEMKEIAKENGISRNDSLVNKFTKMIVLFSKGKVSKNKVIKFGQLYSVHQYCQGFGEAIRLNAGDKK